MLGLPDLLVLDEPTNGLDPPQIPEMREVLRALRRRRPHGAGLQPPAGRGGADLHPRGGDAPRAGRGRRAGRARSSRAAAPPRSASTPRSGPRAVLGELDGVRARARRRRRGARRAERHAARRRPCGRSSAAGWTCTSAGPRRRLEDAFLAAGRRGLWSREPDDAVRCHAHGPRRARATDGVREPPARPEASTRPRPHAAAAGGAGAPAAPPPDQVAFGLVVALPVILWIAFELAPTTAPPSSSVSLVDLAKGSGGQLRPVRAVRVGVVPAGRGGGAVLRRHGGGEASWSSLRYLLAVPVPRARLLRQKAVVAAMLSVAALLLLPSSPSWSGALAYGTGDLVSPTGESLTFLPGRGPGAAGRGVPRRLPQLGGGAGAAAVGEHRRPARRGRRRGAGVDPVADPRPDHRAGGPARLPAHPLRQRLVGPARRRRSTGGT